ncbi:MAG TPA: AAA family ATPase [Candidatus Nanoarchaeia archaeon]|nr:AAA family ATPase [Candidatus Nanoarchaeia archaeon]
MYLKQLEINGFKSFAKKSELTFTTPITSIVGPNGSGKSNAAEAFRFVLGEQSLKSMRGKKGEDMIFNGSDSIPRANRASVKITFDNTRRYLNLDFDEVSIERTVFRDGVNEYSINGTRVRLKDVIELLASAHIGASGHHIISQGEADRILNSNIKERKAMIEDALGLKIYQYKMEESERKLEKTQENIKSVESLRREVAPHLKFLKKQVEKVEKAVQMKAELLGLYKEYLKRENSYIKAAKEIITREKTPLEKRLAELDKELRDAKHILEKSKSQDAKSHQVIALEDKMRKARNEKDELVRQIGRTEGEIASEERILKRESEIAGATNQTVSLVEIETLASHVGEEFRRAESVTEVEVLKGIIGKVRNLIITFVSKHKQTSATKNAANSESILKDLKTKKADLEKRIRDVQHEEETYAKEYSALRSEIDQEKDTNRAAEKKVFEVMTAQNEMIGQKNVLRSREDALRIEEEAYKRELGEAAAIVGREVLDFENFHVQGLAEDTTPDARAAQHDRRRAIEKIKIRLEESGVGATDEVMKEFRDVSERDAFLAKELEDLVKSADALKMIISDFSEKISTEFETGLGKINKQFEEFFALMFGGGQAKLILVKEKKRKMLPPGFDPELDAMPDGVGEDEEVEEGIEISVNLPRKKIKSLMMLSGGERALTSIALIFAMSQVKPPPFIILDETDAALDEANSKKYGDMIENLSKYSQLILITHNRETMSRAGVLYGVTMLSGVSKLLSIQFDEAVAVAK